MLTIKNAGGLIDGPRAPRSRMKKIKLIRTTVVDGEVLDAGWSGLVPEKDAVYLIRIGKAVPSGKQIKQEKNGGNDVKRL